MKKTRLLVIVIVIVIILSIVFLFGTNRISSCETMISPGITTKELTTILGEPIDEDLEIYTNPDSTKYQGIKNEFYSDLAENKTMYYFSYDALASGPIRAVIDTSTNTLIAIKCSEDGEWKTKN